MEKNQNGKYNIRIRATFAKGSWSLSTYFLASSFNAAMKKLEESFQLLQKNEERLRFWGVERTDDPNMAGDLLQEFGLWLDRRHEFPRKVADFSIAAERAVPASMLAPVRRILADSVSRNVCRTLWPATKGYQPRPPNRNQCPARSLLLADDHFALRNNHVIQR